MFTAVSALEAFTRKRQLYRTDILGRIELVNFSDTTRGGVTLHCQACPPFLSTASNPTCTSIASRVILYLSPLVQKLLNQTRQSSFEPMASNPTHLVARCRIDSPHSARLAAVVRDFGTSFKAGVMRDHA
jgi:hypothetical protein